MPHNTLEQLAALSLRDREERIREEGKCLDRIAATVQMAVEQGIPKQYLEDGRAPTDRRLATAGLANDAYADDPSSQQPLPSTPSLGDDLCSRVVAAFGFLLAEPREIPLVQAIWFWEQGRKSPVSFQQAMDRIPNEVLTDLVWSVACEQRVVWTQQELELLCRTGASTASDHDSTGAAEHDLQDKAFGVLVERLNSTLRRFAQSESIGCPSEAVESVVNAALSRIWEHYWSPSCTHRFSARSTLPTLAYGYVRYLALEHLKKQRAGDTTKHEVAACAPPAGPLRPSVQDASLRQAVVDCTKDYFHGRAASAKNRDEFLRHARDHTIYLLHRVYGVPQNQIDGNMLPDGSALPGRAWMAELIKKIDTAIAPCLQAKGFSLDNLI